MLIGVAALLGAASASAQDRCEGTLCDLYYGHVGEPSKTPPPPAPAKATVTPNDTILGHLFGGSQQQPSTDGSAPTRKPVVAVQGGGLLGMMQGAPQERCTGTLCDFYYGGPPPEKPAVDRAATGGEPAAEDAPQTETPSRVIEQPEERHCADTRDPWACYRR